MKTKRSLVLLSLLLLTFCISIFAVDDANAAQRGRKGGGVATLTAAEKATMIQGNSNIDGNFAPMRGNFVNG